MDAAACAEEFRRRLDAAADATESALDALLAAAPLPGEIARPARLLEAVRYSSLGGGKRLRPFWSSNCRDSLASSAKRRCAPPARLK